MASNQTEHYGLNQWSPTDRVLMAEFNADNQAVDTALDALDGKIDTSLTGLESRLNTSLTALEGQFSTSLTALETDVASLDTDVTALESSIGTLKSDATALKSDVSTLKTDVSTLKTDRTTLKSDVSTLKSGVSSLNGSVSTLNSSLTSLESKHDTSIAQLSAQIPHVQTGTYVGAGTFGADGPNTLTLSFPPKLIVINQSSGGLASSGTDWFRFIAVRGTSLCYSEYSNNIYAKPILMHLTWSGNSLSWYGDAAAAQEQGNAADVTYHYVAIG